MHLKLLIIYCTKNLSEQTAPISVKHDKKPKLGLFRSQGNYILLKNPPYFFPATSKTITTGLLCHFTENFGRMLLPFLN